ncbi:unnamed protein product, partial [marine sediment metagenome]
VVGVKRRSSTDSTGRLDGCKGDSNFNLIEGDITDPSSVSGVLSKYKPDEVYNLAAQSHVATSFEQPTTTFQINAVGVLNILEGIHLYSPHSRFYQANTSEMFGSNYTQCLSLSNVMQHGKLQTYEDMMKDMDDKGSTKYQNEETPLSPNSPYAVAKVSAHHLVDNYRRAYGMYASCGILFNHESPRRGEEFVTRKITKWIGEFSYWRQHNTEYIMQHADSEDGDGVIIACRGPENPNTDTYSISLLPDRFSKLRLGNLDAQRDWGHAKDYVNAMWLMLQQEKPDDYVVATGKTYSVRDFLTIAWIIRICPLYSI